MDVAGAGRGVESASREAARHPWVHGLARAGYFARAAVYVVVGALALSLAAGAGGRTTDSRGALRTFAEAPFGSALLVALAAGLAGLALWRLVEAIADPDRDRGGRHRWAIRLGRLVVAGLYALLATSAVRLFLGARDGGSGDATARSWTGKVLALPLGAVLVGVTGAVLVAVGIRQIRRGLRRDFMKDLDPGRMGAGIRPWVERAGRWGIAAQGLVFGLVGAFLVQAAITHDAREATGFDGALAAIARQPSGAILLGLVALGLLLFAAYSAAEGAYKKFRTA